MNITWMGWTQEQTAKTMYTQKGPPLRPPPRFQPRTFSLWGNIALQPLRHPATKMLLENMHTVEAKRLLILDLYIYIHIFIGFK